MKIVSFDPFRGSKIPNIRYIKPQLFLREINTIKEADWIIYPEYWQVNSLVYGLKKKIFPNINSYHIGHDKIEITRALLSISPEIVPITEILNNTDNNKEYILDTFSFPFVAKEIRNSCGRGVFLIHNRKEFNEYCSKNEILYIQEYLPISRDMRIIYMGDEILCGYWRVGQKDSFKNNIAVGGSIKFDKISVKAMDLVFATAKQLGINHAGFDVVELGDQYYILEFNTLFGLEGIKKLNIDVDSKIYEYLINNNDPENPFFDFPGKKIS